MAPYDLYGPAQTQGLELEGGHHEARNREA